MFRVTRLNGTAAAHNVPGSIDKRPKARREGNDMARTAKAAVYEAPNTPFIIKTYPLRPAKPGEVLVKVTMSTICRSDIHSYEGRRPNPCPGILGHEIIGVIEEIGAGIEKDMRGDPLKVRDRITWSEYFFHGDCYYREVHDMPQKCHGVRKYGHDLAEEDPHFLGGFAEYCYILPGTWILKLPDELSDEEATPLNCGVATMASVTEAAEIALGDAVVVQGLGLLGLYGCAMAKARGARLVIGLDAVPDRLEVAKKFGADQTFNIRNLSDKEVVAKVRALCKPDGADAVIEVCGVPDVIPQGLQLLRVGGRYVLGGLVNPDANVTIDANMLVKRWVTMRGIHNYHPRHLIQALDFVMANRKRFPFKDIVDSKFALKDLDSAFKKASERSVLRAAIVP
jgi:putative phosphonate catabolism associated alcohol dehydrogenase